MTCNTCGENKPKHTARAFPKAVVEINNPEQLVLMRKVVLPASMGTEEDVPASVGKYRNVLLVYEANDHIYLYSSDGIPTLLTQESADLDELWQAIHTEEATRETADTALSARIDGVTTAIETEEARRISADSALQANINTVSGDLGAEITARQNADTAIRGDLTTLTGRVTTAEGDIDTIEGKIPSQATAQNQLADKDFVNSSVATNTANFIGTFNSVAELEAYSGTVTNNDYAFVIVTDAQGNTAYDRYKYNGDTEQWIFEYELNNSSFTAEQWAAINSGITSGDVTKLSGLANIKTIGANLNLSQAGELSATDTTYTAGANVQISNQNVISATDTTYTHFTGATASTDGTQGLVPGPLAGDEDKYLKGDGTWGTVQAGPTVVQTTGASTTDVMSQNAVTSMVYADPSTQHKIKIGAGTSASEGNNGIEIGRDSAATANASIALGYTASTAGATSIAIGNSSYIPSTGANAIAIGNNAAARAVGSIALGARSNATAQGEINAGTTDISYGYNNSQYRLLTGLYDPQSAHDAATKGYVDGNIPSTFTTNEWNALWA